MIYSSSKGLVDGQGKVILSKVEFEKLVAQGKKLFAQIKAEAELRKRRLT